MKENQVEFLFIGIIIIVFALWKITQNIKTRCYESAAAARAVSAARFKEGFAGGGGGSGGTPTAVSQDTTILMKAKELLKNSGIKDPFSMNSVLTTENFTPDTSENDMTIHQRRKAATVLDRFETNAPPPSAPGATAPPTAPGATAPPTAPGTAAPPIAPGAAAPPTAPGTAVPPPPAVKEGLENADEKSKEIIERNITSINPEDSQSKFKLRDYYIKAAYNAFNPYKFKNSTVSMDALLYVIARGCRFIDFEVFSVDNEPVIASSSVNSFNYKETFNHIPVIEAFEVLGSYVFSGAKCPNPSDPFIIHMRIMSRNITMYDKLANVITQSKTVARNLLGPKYGREYQSKDLGNEDLLDFKGKIILMVDGTNPVYRETKLFELINMSSNSLFLSKYTYFGVKNIGDPQAFKDANKKNMCLVVPDKSGRPINEGHNGPYTWGCQIATMCFQEEARDEKLKAYEDKFASVGYAFILKPEDLRYVPITIAPPAPPDPKSSMEARPTEAAGGVKISL
jgi:hypothetical protein